MLVLGIGAILAKSEVFGRAFSRPTAQVHQGVQLLAKVPLDLLQTSATTLLL